MLNIIYLQLFATLLNCTSRALPANASAFIGDASLFRLGVLLTGSLALRPVGLVTSVFLTRRAV
jgi:hypothetical protein